MEAFLESLGTPGPALCAVAGLFALAFLVGRPWARRAGEAEPVAEACLALILGLDLVALGTLVLAWSGGLAFLPLRGLLGAALALAVFRFVRRARGRVLGPVPWHALPLVGLGLVFAAVGLAHPFSWDDLVYQIEVPRRWSEAGGLPVFGDLPYSGFPGAFALLNLVLVRAGGILAPAVFNAGLWLVLALTLQARLGARIGRGPGTVLALAFALAWPAVMEAISAYAELFLALHLLALTSLAERGFEGEERAVRARWTALGLASGVAAAIKLTGAIVPLWTGLLFARAAWRGRGTGSARPRARAAHLLVPLVSVLVLFYARPALATGNPLHPYCAGLFSGDEAARASSAYHHDAGTARFGVPLEASLATLGHFAATPVLLGLGPFGDLGRFDGLVGLQFLALLLPLGALAWAARAGRSRAPRSGPWLAGAALLYSFWFLSSQQARFLLPACLLFTLGAAPGWPALPRAARIGLGAALPLLALASLPARTYQHLGLALRVLAGQASAVEYVESAQGDRYMPACQAILERTPGDARLLLLYEQRGLYVPRAHWIGTPFFQERFFTPSERVPDARTFLAALAEARITHVLVGYNPNDPDRMEAYLERTRPFQELLVSLRGQALEVLWESREDATGDVRHGLYRVRAVQGPTR